MAQEISFDDLIPATKERAAATPAVSSTAPVTSSNEISFDDLLPVEKQGARSSTTPIVEGEGGAAFSVYPKPGMQPDSVSRLGKNIYRTAGEAVIPTGAGFAGFGSGMAIAAPYAAAATAATAATGVGAPFAPIVGGAITLGGGFGGAMVASGAARWLQDLMHKTFEPEDYKQRQIEKLAYPTSTFLTELGVSVAGMSPKTVVNNAASANKLVRLASTPAGQRVMSGGLMGGIETGTQYAETGTVDPFRVVASSAAGAAMPSFNVAGKIPFVAGQKIGEKISSFLPGGSKPIKPTVSDIPPKPPEGSTPEEKQAYIDKLKTIVSEREAKIPLVETAIKNKETGEIELMGPKHNEQRKLETIDTHDQGFITEDNRFLDRKQAFEQAKRSGQIPEGQNPTDISIGLRSEDLRKAGDKRFEITEQQQQIYNKKNAEDDFELLLDGSDWMPANKPPYEGAKKSEDGFWLSRDGKYTVYPVGGYGFKVVLLDTARFLKKNGIGFAHPNTEVIKIFETIREGKNPTAAHKELVRQLNEFAKTPEDFAEGKATADNVLQKAKEHFATTKNQPISRQDFKTAIDDKEFRQGVSLEIDMVEAERSGDIRRIAELKAEDARLTAEIEQLRKNIPDVKFADVNKPTWEELHDYLWGARNVGQAFDRLVSNNIGTPQEQLLAKLLSRSQFIRNANLEFEPNYLLYVDPQGNVKNDAIGLYTGEDIHTVKLGKDGDIQTLLHEAIHAATLRLLIEGNSVAAKKLIQLHKEFLSKHDVEYQIKLKAFKDASPNRILTVKELNDFRKENKAEYGLTNVREFVAEAFTNKEFQELLASIESKEPGSGVTSNLWEAFKNYVREGLNIPPGKRTAFDDVMDSGITLVEQSKQFSRFDAPSESYLKGTLSAPSRLSQEIHDQLGREGIAIAHTSPYKFGMFNWVKHALSGEGANAFGAGTYGSQKDSTNKYYVEMAKQKALDKYFENNPEASRKKEDLEIQQDYIDRKLTREYDFLADQVDTQLLEASYRARRTFNDYVAERNEYYDAVDPADPTIRKQYNEYTVDAERKVESLKIKQQETQNKIDQLKADNAKLRAAKRAILDEAGKESKVPTYHSSIKATSDELLDWNSTQQSKLVNNAFKTLGIEPQSEKLTWNKVGEDRYTTITSNGQDLFLGRRDAGLSDGWNVIDSLTGETIKHTRTFEEAQSNNKSGNELYRELSKKFEPQDEATRNLITDREAQQIGDAKASIALAEQGVVGNVHDAQGGTEQKFRNYVVFDDSRITQNLVSLASIKKKTTLGSPDEPSVVDRTKTNPRDVQNEKEFYEIATDIYQKHGEVEAVKFFEGYQEYKKTFLEPIKETEKFVGINLQSKSANELIIHNNTSDIKKLAGKDVDLEQLSFDIDKGIPLVGKVKDVADKFRTLMDELGKRALENNVIKGWHQDYVARNVVTEGAAPPTAVQEFISDVFGYKGGGGVKTTTKYGQERRLESREDLVNHIEGLNSWLESQGVDYRFKLKTNNLADIYKDYALSVEKAIENKNLIDNLKQIRNVAGESLIKKIDDDNPLPYRWEQINHPNLAGYAVHPDIVPHLKFVFDAGPGRLMSALGNISQWTKFFNVIGSFFHAKSLMEVLSSAKIPIWTPIKEGIVLPLVEQGVKALTGKELQLSAITKALDQMRKGGVGSNVDTWIKSELTFEMPEDVTKGVLTSLGKFTDSMIGKYGPKTRVLEKSLSTVEKYTLGAFNKYTWDYLHTGGKLFVADSYLNRARMQAAKEGKPFDEMAVRKEIARFVNESFGGLNWYDIVRQTEGEFAKRMSLAAYSPDGRRALQVLLFAPDWTISTIRAFTAALPKQLNPTKWQPVEGIKGMMTPTTRADYARLYQFKTALTYLTLYNAINMLTANRPIWENKDPTRIEYPDSTSMQAAKHAMEPYHWIADPIKTLSNKLGFLPKAAIISIAGTEYASPQAPKLVDPSALNRLKAAASGALPFQVQAAMSAPEGEGAKRALLGTLGFPVYGGTAEQKKTARAEREKILKANAARYRQKEKEAGR